MAHPQRQVNPKVIDAAAKEWIAVQQHTTSAVDALRLKYGLKEPYYSCIAQIAAKIKYQKKFDGLPSEWVFPTGQALEQSSSVATAKYKSSLLDTAYFVDLCAGMGIDTWAFEALSTTKSGLCFEVNAAVARLLEHNLSKTKVQQSEAELSQIDDWMRLNSIESNALTIYLDPDRRAGGKRTFGISEGTPNLLELQSELLQRSRCVIAKHSPMLDLESSRDLQHLSEVVIVQLRGECKEILTIQERSYQGQTTIKVIELDTNEVLEFQENFADVPVSADWNQFLIQPAAALSKSGAHHRLAAAQNWKATAFGNLYTSAVAPKASSHYRVYKVIEECAPYKFKTTLTKAAIECIGFPETVDAVRKKLKVKEGSTQKVFALRSGRKKSMILCQRVS